MTFQQGKLYRPTAWTTMNEGVNVGARADRYGIRAKSIRYDESIGLIRLAERAR